MRILPYKLTDDQVIANVVTAFQGYALDDIKFNQGRPIAAGILIACLLDQMAGFIFKDKKATHRAQKFVYKYLPGYKDAKLYDIMRNALVHHYSLNGNHSLTSDGQSLGRNVAMSSDGVIFIPSLIPDLEVAINKAVIDLRENPEIRAHALKWHETHSVLALHQIVVYSYDQIDKLWEAYKPLFELHPENKERHLTISFESRLMGEDKHALYVIVVDHNEDTILKVLFKDYLTKLGLPYPDELIGGKPDPDRSRYLVGEIKMMPKDK
jgi:hypothetical protein